MIREDKIDGMQLRIYETREEMGQAAAAEAVDAIRRLLAEKETINMIFGAAPSQNEMLAALVASDVDFGRIRAFHMDEYLGLPMDAPQRFSRFLDDHIFAKVPFKEVHYLLPEGVTDAEEASRRYSDLLERYPVDITMMGIGENGHIAFNDPHEAKFDDPCLVRKVTLDDVCRQQQVNDGCFATMELVPKEALTLTVPALMSAETVICTVPGPTKREAVRRTVMEPVSESCPASVMRKYSNSILVCDRASGADLL